MKYTTEIECNNCKRIIDITKEPSIWCAGGCGMTYCKECALPGVPVGEFDGYYVSVEDEEQELYGEIYIDTCNVCKGYEDIAEYDENTKRLTSESAFALTWANYSI